MRQSIPLMHLVNSVLLVFLFRTGVRVRYHSLFEIPEHKFDGPAEHIIPLLAHSYLFQRGFNGTAAGRSVQSQAKVTQAAMEEAVKALAKAGHFGAQFQEDQEKMRDQQKLVRDLRALYKLRSEYNDKAETFNDRQRQGHSREEDLRASNLLLRAKWQENVKILPDFVDDELIACKRADRGLDSVTAKLDTLAGLVEEGYREVNDDGSR